MLAEEWKHRGHFVIDMGGSPQSSWQDWPRGDPPATGAGECAPPTMVAPVAYECLQFQDAFKESRLGFCFYSVVKKMFQCC